MREVDDFSRMSKRIFIYGLVNILLCNGLWVNYVITIEERLQHHVLRNIIMIICFLMTRLTYSMRLDVWNEDWKGSTVLHLW